MPLSRELREFVALLNSHRVEFLIVGAYAVAFHGYPRYTGDLDILVRPNTENASRVQDVLVEFGFGGLGIRVEDLAAPGKVVQLGVSPNRIDVITSITGVTFEQAWDSREQVELDGVAVSSSVRRLCFTTKKARAVRRILVTLQNCVEGIPGLETSLQSSVLRFVDSDLGLNSPEGDRFTIPVAK